MALFLAIDAGGTSTRTILVNDAGRCLAYSKTAGGNPISSGLEVAAASIVEGVSLCLETAGLEHAAVSGVTLAMAGASTIRQTGWIEVPLGAIGVTAPVRLEHDLLATFHYGTAQLDGYVLLEASSFRTFDATKNYLWPVPTKEIALNANLTQNPGWQ